MEARKMIRFECMNERQEDCNICGTSFHGVELDASVEVLIELFGEPFRSDDGKTRHEWIFKATDGRVATVYDYKYDGAAEGYWHVGGSGRGVCEDLVKFIKWEIEKSL
jgi:hypothetical protein